jgi:hypothetical protein
MNKAAVKSWDKIKEHAWKRREAISREGRDIAPLPTVVNPARKYKALRSFKFFCENYFPAIFNLKWSPDHLKVIAKIERAVIKGGLFAMAMPRKHGKSSLCETASIWALVKGDHEFVVLVGADLGAARGMLESIKTEFETNDLLLEDFPEVVYPIRMLGGIYQRAGGQLFNKRPTYIGWTAGEVVLPTMPRSKASGAIIRVAGIEARIRGMKFKRVDGRAVRPSLAIIDDPQTDESARSPEQVKVRLGVINKAILNLSGPGKKIAAIMPCTVIQQDDLASQILDNGVHPDWQGERMKMVYSFPLNQELWVEYKEIRASHLKSGGDGSAATEFYRENRAKMDAGAKVAWAAQYDPGELSAIQHAMNLLYRDEKSFWSEHQNEPMIENDLPAGLLTAEDILKKMNGLKRGEPSPGTVCLTAFIDVHADLLYWTVCAWEDKFTGAIVDYGTYPDQKGQDFTLSTATWTLSREMPAAGLEARIYYGLEKCVGYLFSRKFGPGNLQIGKCFIDANWGQSTDVVYRFATQSHLSSMITPSHGHYFGAASIPMRDYKKKVGDRLGINWRMPVPAERRIRHILFDTNWWKSFVYARFAVPMGDPGCLSIFGRSAEEHSRLVGHLTSEYPVRTEGRGRQVDEWRRRVEEIDNHWFDCLVGCSVAASVSGVELFTPMVSDKPRQRLKLSDMQKKTSGGVQ